MIPLIGVVLGVLFSIGMLAVLIYACIVLLNREVEGVDSAPSTADLMMAVWSALHDVEETNRRKRRKDATK